MVGIVLGSPSMASWTKLKIKPEVKDEALVLFYARKLESRKAFAWSRSRPSGLLTGKTCWALVAQGLLLYIFISEHEELAFDGMCGLLPPSDQQGGGSLEWFPCDTSFDICGEVPPEA
jgi:hypothetical protein